MIARLICWYKGHKRGKRILRMISGGTVEHNGVPVKAGESLYECPRCKATWTRKVKA